MKRRVDTCRYFFQGNCLPVIAVISVFLLLAFGASAALASGGRPIIEQGGSNHVSRVSAGPRAPGLTTQDLNSGLTPGDLVTALLGPGVSVSNVSFSGVNVAAGTFSGGTGIVGFESGIILSSGSISFVPGPNTQDDTSGVNTGAGDPDLDALIPGYTTYDAVTLEFDFQCSGTQVIQFQYTFTSEEYNEWVNSPFNDVFGFFLNGVNIALVPGSAGTPVSINNVNCDNPYNPPNGSYCNLFVNNDCTDIPPGTFPCNGMRDIEMDGMTVILTATGTLNPGLNHIKLAVSDAGDQVLDSNVFIQAQSFVCGDPTGACCDTILLTCTDNVLQANCQGPNNVWTVGLACNQLNPPCPTATVPDGTDCANPIPITTLPFTDVNSTSDKGNDYSNTCLGNYDNGQDILYELTIGTTQCVDITVTGATPLDNWIGVTIDGACPPGTACLAKATSQGTVATITNLTLVPGTYYLMIDRWPQANGNLDFTLSIADCGGAPTGACCNTGTQICTDNVLEVNCLAIGDAWSVGVTCGSLNPPCAPEVDPIGQDCEFPIVVTSVPFEDVNTTFDKKEDYSNTCLGVYDNGDDIVYEIVLAESHCLDITVAGATPIDHSIGVAVDSACPPGMSCIAHGTTPGTVVNIGNLQLDAGTYYVMIDRQPDPNGFAVLDFRLSIADCAAPSGACCFQNGQCAQLTEADCFSANGVTWSVDSPCSPNPCDYVKGDVNCSHSIGMDDIAYFVAALLGEPIGCDVTLADMNGDGFEDGLDVQGFVDVLVFP